MLPAPMQEAVRARLISEGHTRPLLMLIDRPDQQQVMFTDITTRNLTVRDAEQLARRIATERVRKGDLPPELLLLERELTEKLGTRVRIEKKEPGGKVLIDFFSIDDLAQIRAVITGMKTMEAESAAASAEGVIDAVIEPLASTATGEATESEEDLYSVKNFSV